MEILDIGIAVVLLYGVIKGITKGLFSEIASLLALILGIYGSIHFSFYAKNFLTTQINLEPRYIALTAFAITFLAIVIGISLAGKLLTKLASAIALGWLNRILGAVFGLLKVGLILSVILGWLERVNGVVPFISQEQVEKSILFTPVKNLAPAIFPAFLDQLNKNSEQEENNETKSI